MTVMRLRFYGPPVTCARRRYDRGVQPGVSEHIVQRRRGDSGRRGIVRSYETGTLCPAVTRVRRLSGWRTRTRWSAVFRASALRSQNARWLHLLDSSVPARRHFLLGNYLPLPSRLVSRRAVTCYWL